MFALTAITPETWIVVAVVFAATLTRATFGFGEALIAMPLLSMLVGIHVAAPLIAVISVTTSVVILATDWRHVHFRSALALTVASAMGIPIGLFGVAALPETAVKAVLALVIIGFSSYCLFGTNELALRNDRLAFLFGWAAGVLGGAYNTQGPPVVIYGTLRKWSAEHFRATLQGFFLPTSVVIAVGHGFRGRVTWSVVTMYLACLIPVLAALLGGSRLNRYIRDRGFARYVHLLLIIIGASLLVNCVVSAGP